MVGMNGFIFEMSKPSSLTRKKWLGRCLGPAKNEGNAMAQWILKENGRVVPCCTLCHFLPAKVSPLNEVKMEK
jgi:hypothetical protein